MGKVYFDAKVNEDGSLVIPGFATRGLDYAPGETVSLAVPTAGAACDYLCGCDELLVVRCCPEVHCTGYATDENEINLPPQLFARAGLPVGADFHLFAGDQAIVLVAGADHAEDLHAEIEEILTDLCIETGPCVSLRTDF